MATPNFNDAILSKRSPLARVWLAATLERKVTKHHFLSASIPKSVEAIVAVEMVPMALRLSGQLLLGVARMYSRKAKYLMDDATETLSRVKIAFRAGGSRNKDVDLATDQQTAHKNAITLQNTNSNEFDAIYQDMQYRSWEDALEAELAAASKATPSKNKKRTTATDAEITLPDHDGMLGPYDFDLDYQGRGIDSQQFAPEDFNLDLDLDAHLPGDDLRSQRAQSVEVGRDAPSSAARKSNRASSPLSSLNGAGGMDVDFDGGLGLDQSGADASAFASGADFDFEAGAGFDLGLDLDGQRTPRAASPSPAAEGEQPQVKATSAVEGNEEDTNQEDTTPQAKKANKRKAPAAKKQVVDSVIELESPSKRSRSSQSNALSASDKTHLISPQYLSADPARQCLTQLDFNAYLPQLDPSKEFLCMPSIYQSSVAPELHDLFKISAPGSASRKRDSSNKQDSPRKKQRTDENAPPSPEIGLRQSIPPSSEVGNDFEAGGGGADFGDLDAPMGDMSGGADFSNMENDFRFELESNKSRAPSEGAESRRSASVFSARSGASRRSNMFQEEDTMARGDADALLAPFDDLRLASTSRDVSRSPARSQEASQATGVNENVLKGKWSKSSRVAIKLLDQELGPVEDEQPDRSKSLSFEKAADKGSRRAAASFFFELLVLSSRNCVSVAQQEAYGDIDISAKPALFEAAASLPTAFEAASQVAPSRASSIAPLSSAPVTPTRT